MELINPVCVSGEKTEEGKGQGHRQAGPPSTATLVLTAQVAFPGRGADGNDVKVTCCRVTAELKSFGPASFPDPLPITLCLGRKRTQALPTQALLSVVFILNVLYSVFLSFPHPYLP